ncbi:hypothetical protein CDAR_67701 [Caerostris darwini]|uniref:Uncharacterized protein n=1 Tax=Caerostris darwini TaxID=1538125 RepID=A0AAV4TFN6_9ARAC|nr:hypothetical protein CDAR_67701 [Caerostris darwini]
MYPRVSRNRQRANFLRGVCIFQTRLNTISGHLWVLRGEERAKMEKNCISGRWWTLGSGKGGDESKKCFHLLYHNCRFLKVLASYREVRRGPITNWQHWFRVLRFSIR